MAQGLGGSPIIIDQTSKRANGIQRVRMSFGGTIIIADRNPVVKGGRASVFSYFPKGETSAPAPLKKKQGGDASDPCFLCGVVRECSL